MQVEEGGFYRDRRGRLWGPMKQLPNGQWEGVQRSLAWGSDGRFSSQETDWDFVERVYVSTSPPASVRKIGEASLPRVKRIIETIEALRDGTTVWVTEQTEIGARVALSDYYKGELRALGLVIE
jgi:hypothetical protein